VVNKCGNSCGWLLSVKKQDENIVRKIDVDSLVDTEMVFIPHKIKENKTLWFEPLMEVWLETAGPQVSASPCCIVSHDNKQ
jgi:hypothetical protein